jgi:hypothetical protein
MPEKALLGNLEWAHVWLAAITALWGGLVSYLRRIQGGHPHSWGSAVMHLGISGFAGLLCWLGCLQFDVPGPLTAICTGLAGHMGVEFIKIIEMRFEARLLDGAEPLRRATDLDPFAETHNGGYGRRSADKKDQS